MTVPIREEIEDKAREIVSEIDADWTWDYRSHGKEAYENAVRAIADALLALLAERDRLVAESDALEAQVQMIGHDYDKLTDELLKLRAERDAAFAGGAQAMREAMAQYAGRHEGWYGKSLVKAIRSLPLPTPESEGER